MRQSSFVLLLVLASLSLDGQQLFPIKKNKKWGLINSEGQVVLAPRYDAIGEFKRYGYAVMQRDGGVGLLDQSAREIVQPRYDDLKVLDSALVAVLDAGDWMVIDLQGRIVLQKGYERVRVLPGSWLAFRREGLWGVVARDGRMVSPPAYEEIEPQGNGFFLTRRNGKFGLLAGDGREVLPNQSEEIEPYSDSLFFFRKGRKWGAVDPEGAVLIPPEYDDFRKLSDDYIKLITRKRLHLYSLACNTIITTGDFDNFYSFSSKYVIAKKDRQLGLIDRCGDIVIAPRYFEIQAYEENLFRVNLQGKWGVVRSGEEVVTPFEYDYIAPLRTRVSIVKRKGLFGLINYRGEEVAPPQYHRIELEGNRARAYLINGGNGAGETLCLLEFDERGALTSKKNFQKHFKLQLGPKPSGSPNSLGSQNDYLLDKYEWFYAPTEDRWGLRRLNDGEVQISPKFDYVSVAPDLGFTVVGIDHSGQYEFERTTFRFDMAYGLVNNDLGALVTEIEFWDVRLSDFGEGLPVARVVFSNGRHGLIDRIGRIVRRDFAYIGRFRDGVARVSVSGRLSGSMKEQFGLGRLREYLAQLTAPAFMSDYTQYDQLFRQRAHLVCQDCEWGYLDTSATIVVPPAYSFAEDFVNGVGIVACNDKWGMVDREANVVIPCRYDGVHFLEHTGNQIVRVYVQQPKYGLIDTLGQLTVNAVYDEIGSFSEGRLAVRRNGMWGYVNRDGLEVIPCRFREVANFSEGLAAVRIGNSWGFIDKQGNVEIAFKYRRTGNFRDGLAWVLAQDGAGYINPDDQMIITPQFDRAFDFDRGVARVVKAGKYGLIDRRGEFIQKPKYIEIQDFDRHGLAVVSYGSGQLRYGLINLAGTLITRQGFRQIDPFQEGLAVVRYRDAYGYVDTTGALVIPAEYSKAAPFSNGRAAVQRNGECGYLDSTGDLVVPFQFSKCLDYEDGRAVVYQGIRNAGLIDLNGDYILQPEINRLLTFREGRGLVRDEEYRFYYITEKASSYYEVYDKATEFKHGVAVVQVSGKWGIINQRGIEIIPPKYDKIESFQEGFAKVRIKGFNGLTNLRGELIVDPDYEYISYAGDGLFRVEQGDKVGYFDQSGRWIWDLSR